LANNNPTFTTGQNNSLAITVSGNPNPTLQLSGSNTTGLTLDNLGNGNWVLRSTAQFTSAVNRNLTLTATGNGQHTDLNFTLTVLQGATQEVSVNVQATPIAPSAGQTVTLVATVAPTAGGGTPTGKVTFSENGVFLGEADVLAGGVATVPGV